MLQRTNRNFEKLRTKLEKKSITQFHLGLKEFLDGAIIKKNGIYLFENLAVDFLYSSDFQDKVGSEWQVNKIFINQYIEPFDDAEESLLVGYSFANKLAEKIKEELGKGFRIVLTFDYNTTKVAFYKQRPGEILILDDLEKYETDALMLFDT
ncbi:hypothetical protein [uncultured Microscilla sp.]|uniref:hypothetical protein n=1 Tax=uncultured Microscilla sp. TaxID=432653 RepID=UPI00261A7EDC|nr:hypothetical protein [uncultured Microscilla sp.]